MTADSTQAPAGAPGALSRLAAVTGITGRALAHALPAFAYLSATPPHRPGRPQPASGAWPPAASASRPRPLASAPADLPPPPALAAWPRLPS